MAKAQRIFTNRDFPNGGWETIERTANGHLVWRFMDGDFEGAFQIDEIMCAGIFNKTGRQYNA